MAAGDITRTTNTLILTGLAGLASGGSWGSDTVDCATGSWQEAYVGGKVAINSSITADGLITVYAYGSYDGTTMTAGLNNVTLPGAITWGTNTGVDSINDLKWLGNATVDATDDGDMVEFGPFFFTPVYGVFLPPSIGIVLLNSTGAALDATGTGNEIIITTVKMALA